MRKASKNSGESDLLPEYDFRGGIRGKYAKRYAEGTNVVVLEPDVAAAFPDAAAVNEALRALLHIAERNTPKFRRNVRKDAKAV